MASNKLLYRVWKTLDEGLSILEEAAAIVGASTRRLERGIYVGGCLIQPTGIPSRSAMYSRFKMQGFRVYQVSKDEKGKPCLGKVLYEGMDPVMAIRFAVAQKEGES